MTIRPDGLYIELHVPDAKTEHKFLILAVRAAVMKYRETPADSSIRCKQPARTDSRSHKAWVERQVFSQWRLRGALPGEQRRTRVTSKAPTT
jgi:hypothetical protein